MFGKKRKADDSGNVDSPELPEVMKEEESAESAPTLPASDSITSATLNYESLTPRTVYLLKILL